MAGPCGHGRSRAARGHPPRTRRGGDLVARRASPPGAGRRHRSRAGRVVAGVPSRCGTALCGGGGDPAGLRHRPGVRSRVGGRSVLCRRRGRVGVGARGRRGRASWSPPRRGRRSPGDRRQRARRRVPAGPPRTVARGRGAGRAAHRGAARWGGRAVALPRPQPADRRIRTARRGRGVPRGRWFVAHRRAGRPTGHRRHGRARFGPQRGRRGHQPTVGRRLCARAGCR